MADYPERFPTGSCQVAARLMVFWHRELRLVEGWLYYVDDDGHDVARVEHQWNETPGGRIVDATAWALDPACSYRYEPDDECWPRFMLATFRAAHAALSA